MKGRAARVALLALLLGGCVGGAPEFSSCPAGQLDCAGACIDPLLDWGHCGATDCGAAATSGATCAQSGYCSEGECLESDGPFVSPGNPEDGAAVQLPRAVTFQLSWAEPRRLLYTTDGSAPQSGSPSTTETAAPASTILAPGSQLRWQACGDRGERLLRTESGPAQGAGMIVEEVVFEKSGSATVVASPGELVPVGGRMQCWSASEGQAGFGEPIACGARFGGNYACGVTTPDETFAASAPSPFKVNAIAPASPGVYYVRAGLLPRDTCNGFDVPDGQPIGRIIVR